MELRSYGVAKIMRRRHRPVGNTREGIEDVEDRLRAVTHWELLEAGETGGQHLHPTYPPLRRR